MEPSKVFIIREISPEALVKAYDAVGVELPGNVLVKVHSGEKGNQNFFGPKFFGAIQQRVGGTIGECNTAYAGARTNNADHRQLLKYHGWLDCFDVDLLDADGDFAVEIPQGKVIKENYLGSHIENYDSLLVIAHFKGHPMGGFGGSLKQLSIGCASSRGKVNIHTGGANTQSTLITDWVHGVCSQNAFLAAMADAAGSVVRYFDGKAVFVNIMANMSVDCDCCAVAENPCLADVGILASTDPVAIDRACLDIVHNSDDPGRGHFLQRVSRQNGEFIIPCAVEQGAGSDTYELIEIG